MSGKLEFGEEDRTALLGRAWELALHLLASKVNTAAFGYIQPIQPLSYIGNVVTLGVANAFFRERLEKNHANAIRSALEFHLDTTGLQVVLIVMSRDQQRNAENRRNESARRGGRSTSQTALPLDEQQDEQEGIPSDRYQNQRQGAPEDPYGRDQEAKRDHRSGRQDISGNLDFDVWLDDQDSQHPGFTSEGGNGTNGAKRSEREAAVPHTQRPLPTGPRPIPNTRNPLANDPRRTQETRSGYAPQESSFQRDLSTRGDARSEYRSEGRGNGRGEMSAISGEAIASLDGSTSGNGSKGVTRSSAKSKVTAAKSPPPPVPCLQLNDRYKFETFLVGRSNRLAHAGATAVSERPGEVYNPLFIYGGPGLGKTHLMHGIAHSIRKQRPDARIAYVSGEYFAQKYITAIFEHTTEEFRRQYREIDVWLVDDIQFVAGKERTKEEFFHTFNTLYQGGKQIVIASDRSPRELNTMDERLRSRFQSGLIADISAPDLETRIAILHQYRQREGFNVDDEVLDYIASAIQSNIRALEGALTKLIAYSSIHKTSATAELAQSVLSEYFIEKPLRVRKVSLDDVVEAVGAIFGVAPTAIKGPNRNKDVSLARQVAMYLSRELLPEMNTTDLGTAFGNRDHATIIYSSQRVRGLMEMDPELKTLVSQLQKKLLLPDPR